MQLEKFVWTGVAIGAALCIGTAPISAKPGSSGPKMTTQHTSTPKPTSHGSPKTTTTQGPKTTHGAAPKTTTGGAKTTTTTHGQSAAHTTKTTSGTTKTHGNPHTQPVDTTTTTGGTTTNGTTTGGTTDTTTTGGTTTTTPLNKAQQLLTKNNNLQTKLETRLGTQLPQGVTVIDAASGFKNLGQFVAAVNVSNNLGIPFADLKAKMTGMTVEGEPITTTGTSTSPTTMSLGQAIQSLKGVDETTATQTANTATTQANAEIESTTTTTTTTTAPGKTKKRH